MTTNESVHENAPDNPLSELAGFENQSADTRYDEAEIEQLIDATFPFPSYRPHQRDILVEAASALYGADADAYDNVVIYAPTGIGKSPINATLGELAANAFYTTPQKKLREQLRSDEDLSSLYEVLRSRADYHCQASDMPCDICPINHSEETSCRDVGCSYWTAKEDAMGANVATLTFAYLLVDRHLPLAAGDPPYQVSFDDRELLIVDECHQLENQVAGLFAGFSVSPRSKTLPSSVYGDLDDRIPADADRVTDDVLEVLRDLGLRAESRAEQIKKTLAAGGLDDDHASKLARVRERCLSLKRQCTWCREEVGEGRTWTIDDKGYGRYKFAPVLVDRFLRGQLWDRAEKCVLSTATMPFADDPDLWLTNIGLDPDRTKVISRPMPFPVEHRRVNLARMVGKLSGEGEAKHWNDIVATVRDLAERHSGEKGLIHTTSYERAELLHDELPSQTLLHEQNHGDHEDEWYINKWQHGRKDILLSPAMTDGLDLRDDMCRWQVLLKVPYPYFGDPRVRERQKEDDGWRWYNETAAQSIIQSAGRGVRHDEDYCTFYVLDKSYLDVKRVASFPEWFLEAETRVDRTSALQRRVEVPPANGFDQISEGGGSQ